MEFPDHAERAAAARPIPAEIPGLATECGLGRAKTPAMVIDILEIHAALCAA